MHVSQHVSLRGISGVKYANPKLRVQGWCASKVRWCTGSGCQNITFYFCWPKFLCGSITGYNRPVMDSVWEGRCLESSPIEAT